MKFTIFDDQWRVGPDERELVTTMQYTHSGYQKINAGVAGKCEKFNLVLCKNFKR